MNNPWGNHYQSQSIETASPAQLVLMLYDRCLVAIERVKLADARAPRDNTTFNKELQRAQDIVMELQYSINPEGHPIAGLLDRLYDYCLHEFVRANVSKDVALLDGPQKVIGELREAWDNACVKGMASEGAYENVAAVAAGRI